jgi:glyoxylase-like metal-dependent hydrolase (beta-lactamase superfamily II)
VAPRRWSGGLTTPSLTRSLSSPRIIDLLHVGVARVIGCWQVGDVLVDPGPSTGIPQLLEALGDGYEPRALLLTHIHLDHAGASGSLVRRWPSLEVYVHERGAQHMVDPSRLLGSATRLYGDDMKRLWGEVVAVPEERLHVLSGGEALTFGEDRFEVAYTPGHASHHVCYLHDSGAAFVGDVGGVRITAESPAIPPTPPPDIDIEAWHGSIELVAGWRPERLALTHFDSYADVEAELAQLSERLDRWAALGRDSDAEQFMAGVRSEIASAVTADVAAAYEQAAPADQLYAGIDRYWRKREVS